MDIIALPATATQSTARLLIHAGGGARVRGRFLEFLPQWLRALYPAGPSDGERASLRLRIEDLQGREVLALDGAGPLVAIVLPAGTYHVSARRGNVRRGYTMTLKHGASFDLYLYLNRPPVPQ